MSNKGLVSIVPLAVLFCLASAEDELHATLCFRSGENSKEMYINCGSRAVVYLVKATYSIHPVAANLAALSACPYQTEASGCWLSPTPTAMQHMYDRCMGHRSCTVKISPQPIDACGEPSNLFQVAYQCIPDKNETERFVMDICGDEESKLSTTHAVGYVTSPGYPNNYNPDTSCSCFLNATTTSEAVHLRFSILDQDISPGSNPNWASDWLEYVTDISDWAEGVRFNDAVRGHSMIINRAHGYLNFLTDSSKEGRGFWVKYEGITVAGQPVPVQIQCGKFNPPEQRVASTCMPPDHGGELYLDCRSQGVIKVISSRHGYTSLHACPSDIIKGDLCAVTDGEQTVDVIRDRCMGQTDCHVSVSAVDLPTCSLKSNYAQSVYECVERDSLVDICGDSLGGAASIERTNGFIESLSYPAFYSPDTNCTCVLSSMEDKAQIMIYVLDMMLSPRTVKENDTNPFPAAINDCQSDYLEYNLDVNTFGSGIKLCDNILNREPIFTDAKSVYLNFVSDGTAESRGFWIRYAGQLPGGYKSPLQISCHTNLPESEELDNGVIANAGTTPGNTPAASDPLNGEVLQEGEPKSAKEGGSTDVGLVIGLCLTALLVMMLAFGMAVYKRSKSANRPEGSYLSGEQRPQGGLESGNNPFNYSSFGSPGPESSRGTSQGDPLPDYDYGPQRRKSTTASYMNRAFETGDREHHNV